MKNLQYSSLLRPSSYKKIKIAALSRPVGILRMSVLEKAMPGLLPDIDPEGLLEFSVVFTDRSLNHMSARFQQAMRDISQTLKEVYHAQAVAIVPGGGSYGMEAVARQFAHGKNVLVVRNGWFSYRWTQIFEAGQIPETIAVLKARPVSEAPQSAYAPAPIAEVVAHIHQQRPDLVFAPRYLLDSLH